MGRSGPRALPGRVPGRRCRAGGRETGRHIHGPGEDHLGAVDVAAPCGGVRSCHKTGMTDACSAKPSTALSACEPGCGKHYRCGTVTGAMTPVTVHNRVGRPSSKAGGTGEDCRRVLVGRGCRRGRGERASRCSRSCTPFGQLHEEPCPHEQPRIEITLSGRARNSDDTILIAASPPRDVHRSLLSQLLSQLLSRPLAAASVPAACGASSPSGALRQPEQFGRRPGRWPGTRRQVAT